MESTERHRDAAARIAEVTGDDQVAAGSAFWAAFMAALEDPTRERVDALLDTRDRLHAMGDSHLATLPLWIGSALLSGVGRHSEASDLWELARSRIVCERCSVAFWAEGALLDAGARRCRERPFRAPTRRGARACRFATRSSRPGPTSAEPNSRRTRASRGRVRISRPNWAMHSPAATRWPQGSCRRGSRLGYLVDREFRGGRAPSDRAECRRGVARLASAGRDGPPLPEPATRSATCAAPERSWTRPRSKPIDGTPGRCSDRASDGAPPR